MVKIISLFLIAMVVLAIFGRLRLPGLGKRKGRSQIKEARKCPDCGTYVLEPGPCKCKTKT